MCVVLACVACSGGAGGAPVVQQSSLPFSADLPTPHHLHSIRNLTRCVVFAKPRFPDVPKFHLPTMNLAIVTPCSPSPGLARGSRESFKWTPASR